VFFEQGEYPAIAGQMQHPHRDERPAPSQRGAQAIDHPAIAIVDQPFLDACSEFAITPRVFLGKSEYRRDVATQVELDQSV
jgi:hypothetical protein